MYQIWSKSDNSRLRYGDKAIFKMAAIRHFQFANPSSLFQISLLSANMAPRYSQKRFSIWRPSAILNLQNYRLLLKIHDGNWDLHLPTKFDRNPIILGWDMEIMLFSKWRPSAILNLRKLHFWSRNLYRHVIFHLCSKFRFDEPIWRRYMTKKTIFNIASVRRISKITDLC